MQRAPRTPVHVVIRSAPVVLPETWLLATGGASGRARDAQYSWQIASTSVVAASSAVFAFTPFTIVVTHAPSALAS